MNQEFANSKRRIIRHNNFAATSFTTSGCRNTNAFIRQPPGSLLLVANNYGPVWNSPPMQLPSPHELTKTVIAADHGVYSPRSHPPPAINSIDLTSAESADRRTPAPSLPAAPRWSAHGPDRG